MAQDLLFCDRAALQNCEIEILRKSECLEIALLQTRATLEHPPVTQCWFGPNAGKHPPEDIILLHHVISQTPLRDPGTEITFTYHAAP